MLEPIIIDANQPRDRFYRGGHRIDDFRGAPRGSDRRPEDWVASTTPLAGERTSGLSTLPDGRTLSDAVAADPDGWLGSDHLAAFGPSTMLLVKLLDAGQRLPVHAHPDDDFASRHLHTLFGKAEAWYMLEPATVHLGLRKSISPHELGRIVATQDVASLLALLHPVAVFPGDVVYVPPGMLHAIGAGAFLVELQQPSDLSILLEWEGFALDGRREGHLGLGFDIALDAVERDARTDEEIRNLITRAETGEVPLGDDAHRYFRLERWQTRDSTESVSLDRGFAVLVVAAGRLQVTSSSGTSLDVSAGSTIVVPEISGPLQVSGQGTVLVCRPPLPATAVAS